MTKNILLETFSSDSSFIHSIVTYSIKNIKTSLVISLFLCFFFICKTQSQKKYLKISFTDNTSIKLKSKDRTDKSFTSTQTLLHEVQKISDSLNQIGFISHNIDLIKENDSVYNSVIQLNSSVSKLTLVFDTKEKLPPFITNNQLTILFNELELTLNKIYRYYENQGSPFTEIKLEEIRTDNNKLEAKVLIKKSKNRTIDKVIVKGYKNFPKKYIKNHLKINPSTVYSEELLKKTSNSLQNLSFIKEIKKPEVLFTKDSTHLYIYVSKKSTNKFDGLVGFSNNEDNGKLNFNGYIDIELNNSFNKGEQLAVYWNNNGKEQEEFRFKLATPYLLNSPLTPEINFEIFKQDSTFITVDFNLNIKYLINQKNTIGGTFETIESTNLLNNSSNTNLSSYKTKRFGVSHVFNSQSRSNPIFIIQTDLNYGVRKAETISTPQYNAALEFSLTEKIGRRSNIYLRNSTQTLQSSSILYNELFQIGGANTIRGFYEKSIFCSTYNFTNLEYRVLTNEDSYLYTLSDIGFTEDQTINVENRYFSFGLGYVYKTNGGLINMNYAFGKINKESFKFNQGVFHINFKSTF